MPKGDNNIATFLCCSWLCLRVSCCASCGRCRPTDGYHRLDGSYKPSKAASSSVLQDKMFKSVEKVRGYYTSETSRSWDASRFARSRSPKVHLKRAKIFSARSIYSSL